MMAEFSATSRLFEDGGTLPLSVAHSWAGGENRSPSLAWTGAPTDWGVSEFGGALPPPGDPPHHYEITLFALDLPRLDLTEAATYAYFRFSILGHALGEARIVGRVGR